MTGVQTCALPISRNRSQFSLHLLPEYRLRAAKDGSEGCEFKTDSCFLAIKCRLVKITVTFRLNTLKVSADPKDCLAIQGRAKHCRFKRSDLSMIRPVSIGLFAECRLVETSSTFTRNIGERRAAFKVCVFANETVLIESSQSTANKSLIKRRV